MKCVSILLIVLIFILCAGCTSIPSSSQSGPTGGPGGPSPPSPQSETGNWTKQGSDFLNSSKYQESLSAFDKAISLDQNDHNAWAGKGEALLALGKSQDALLAFNKALEINPNNERAQRGKATALINDIPYPSGNPIIIYKGFEFPRNVLDDSVQPMANITLLNNVGANIITMDPQVIVDSHGTMKSKPWHYMDRDILTEVQKYYPAGIHIYIIANLYYEKEFIINSRGGEPKPIPVDIASQPGFLDQYDLFVENMSILAEKYHADIFAPMGDTERLLGCETASQWGQEILPKIRKHYHGKVAWQGALLSTDNVSINFTGYDYITILATPTVVQKREYPASLRHNLDVVTSWVKRDNVSGGIIMIIGDYTAFGTLDSSDHVFYHKTAFEEGKNRSAGFLVTDPPQRMGGNYRQWSLIGSTTYDEIKYWFTKGLNT